MDGGFVGGEAGLFFEFVDLVADEGGAFEFEFGGGFGHFAFEFADDFGDGVFGAVFTDDAFLDFAGFVEHLQRLLDGALGGLGGDAVFGVVVDLDLAAITAYGEEGLDAFGLLIGEEDDFAGDVAGGAAGGLDEGGFAAEEAFFVGVEDADEGDFGEVEAFSEKVDANEDVAVAFAEGAEDFDAFDGVDVAMEVADFESDIAEVVGEVFGGAFGEGGDEDALAALDALAAEFDGFVDLAFEGFDGDDGVEEAGGADDLLDDEGFARGGDVEGVDGLFAAGDAGEAGGGGFGFADAVALMGDVVGVADDGVFYFDAGGGGGDVKDLWHGGHEFVELEGSVVEGAGEAEAVFDEDGFAGAVAFIHAADLGDGGVAFVEEEEEVVGEEVEQGAGGGAGDAAGEVAGVVFDALAEAHFLHHFDVVFGAHFDALGFEEFAFFFKPGDAFVEFGADGDDGAAEFVGGGDELFGGVEGVVGDFEGDGAGKDVNDGNAIDFVAKELDADGFGIEVGGDNFDDVAAGAEGAAFKDDVIALVEHVDEFGEEEFAGDLATDFEGEHHAFVVFGGAQAVNAGDGGDDDDVLAAEEAAHGGEAEALDLVVDAGVLFDVGIGAGDVGLGLVVVEVGDEVFDGVFGEEVLELGVELGGECFVMAHDERRFADLLDDVGHGEGFAGAGDAEEGLVAVAGADGFDEFGDGLALVALGGVFGVEAEGGQWRTLWLGEGYA